MPFLRRKEGGMSQKIYTRRELMMTAEEEVYDGFVRWEYDNVNYTVSALGGQKFWCEQIWGNVSGNKFTCWATSYTGHHKTFDVKVGQKYKIKANAQQTTTIVFCKDRVFATRKTIQPIVPYYVAAGEERVITVPEGYDYMKIYFCNNGSTLFWPERVARLKAYG